MIKEGTAPRLDHYRYFYEVMVISVNVLHIFLSFILQYAHFLHYSPVGICSYDITDYRR
jgi:hypothetical protein